MTSLGESSQKLNQIFPVKQIDKILVILDKNWVRIASNTDKSNMILVKSNLTKI